MERLCEDSKDPTKRCELYAKENSGIAFLEELYSSPEHAAGFKMQWPRQHGLYPDAMHYFEERVETMRIIVLTRNNLLEQAVSWLNTFTFYTKHQRYNWDKREIKKHKPMAQHYDVAAIKEAAYGYQEINTSLKQHAQKFPHVVHMTYEQLQNNQQQALEAICTFLEVPYTPMHSNIGKITPKTLQDAVKNYDELVAAVQGTDLERYL